ncbi:YitT family protein [candidate division WOR-3 bacterium]|nr:YitT family protein [candidate division WOR-3 bacterium]
MKSSCITTSERLKKTKIGLFIYDSVWIVLGSFLAGAGISLYLVPHRIAPGGISGLAQVLYILFGFQTGVVMFAFNIPLFILGVIFIGKTFGAKTVWGIITLSFFVDLFQPGNAFTTKIMPSFLVSIPQYEGYFSLTDQTVLACFAGNVLLGVGLGVIFRHRGSTAGTDIPVALIKKYTGLPMGMGFMIVDTVIILLACLAFKDLNLLIWALLGLFISAKTCDLVMQGISIAKTAYIISDKYIDINEQLNSTLGRGTTMIKSEGGFTGIDRPMIFCVISRNQVFQLIEIVKEIDKNAFIVLYDAFDVLGSGFKRIDRTTL